MSQYADILKESIERISELTDQYRRCLEAKDRGLAAVTKGELSAARAYAQGVIAAGEARRADKREGNG
jgi:hypothetical protein